VDAYPGEVFAGSVTFINHEAEFTPRNVQTQEERVNLVFGVKITLDNPDHRLKPGMPADAELGEWESGRREEEKTGEAAQEQPTIQPTLELHKTPTFQPSNSPTLQPSPTPTFQPSNLSTRQPSIQAEIITWGLNVRTGPGINYPVVAHLAQGTVVPVLATDTASGWLKVPLPNSEQTGWITNSPTYVSIR
jgi:hypothetical protein